MERIHRIAIRVLDAYTPGHECRVAPPKERLDLRFNMIDRVVECQEDRLVAVKAVTSAEEYLADHFPDFPVLPGVMMLETLVQAGRILIDHDWPLIMDEARNVRYGNMVKPGQSLIVDVKLRKRTERGWELDGVGRVDGQVAVQARFYLSALPAPSASPRIT